MTTAEAPDPQFNIESPNLAVNGIITAQLKDGTHHTYRLETMTGPRSWLAGKRVIGLLTGPDNGRDYTLFGFINLDPVHKYHYVSLWRRLDNEVYQRHRDICSGQSEEVQVYLQSGRCLRCNRVLTEPESVRSGYGPTCRGKS